MRNVRDLSDDELFRAGEEQQGSQRAYDKAIEIRRREFLRERQVADAQIEAAKATKATAKATMLSAIFVALTVLLSALNMWLQNY